MIEGLFQPMHLLLILGIALLFFGPKRLPDLGKGLGTSIRDFKDALSGPKPEEKPNAQLEAPKVAVAAPTAAAVAQPAPAIPVSQPTPLAPMPPIAAPTPAPAPTAPAGTGTPQA